MNHLYTASGTVDSMYYNEENRLEKVLLSASMTAYYQYDSSGQRIRKVIENTAASINEVRKYVGSWELYQKINTGTPAISIERETLHVMDDTARVAVIDTLITGVEQTLRYHFSNHLGTASLELDEDANIISYEEYYPFGNTSYQAGLSLAEVSRKRYRYVGMERDDESGFIYIGARYYCPWLARWLAVDPINNEWYNMCKGVPQRNRERDFMELTCSNYEYCYANPVRFTDPTGEQATPEQNMAPRSWPDNAGNKYSLNETGEASVDGGTIKGAKGAGNSNPIRYTNVQLAPNKGPSASNGGQLSGANSESMGWAGLVLAGIELDVSILDPSDAFWPKWAGEAVLGIAAGIAIGLGVNEMTKPETKPVALPIDLPLTDTKSEEKYLYRYDNRSPMEIVKQGGFAARGTETNLFMHAYGEPSIYVSTSKDLASLENSIKSPASGYIYTIKWQVTGRDVNQELGWKSPHPDEQEVAVPYFIPIIDIVNVIQFKKN